MLNKKFKLWIKLLLLNTQIMILERKINQPFDYVASYKMDKILQEIEAIKCELNSYYHD